jgi:uncharacterized protein
MSTEIVLSVAGMGLLDKIVQVDYYLGMLSDIQVRNDYLDQIINRLQKLDLMKILVFGSYATNSIREDSDIDLLVVLNEDFLPETYEEWKKIKMKVRRLLREINKKVPIDLLVYTVPQYELLMKNMSSFFREIHETGKVIYEKAS